jgi:hypothetical protein
MSIEVLDEGLKLLKTSIQVVAGSDREGSVGGAALCKQVFSGV